MKQHRTLSSAALALILATSLTLPAAALFGWGESEGQENPSVSAFSKNGLASQPISFDQEDFVLTSAGSRTTLDSIVISGLPDEATGILAMGNTPLSVGDSIAMSAVSGLRFLPAGDEGGRHTAFTFTPCFSTGETGEAVSVDLYLLSEANSAPVAKNLEFTTYRDIAYTGTLDAVDPEGDLLTFRLVEKPARGSVLISEDGSGTFVYTPYEGKTGKDSFTFVACDPVGNTSEPATVSLRIEKPSTSVTYADLEGHPAHSAAIRLAEEGLLIGQQVNGQYFLYPDQQVSRSEFLTLAMGAAGVDALEDITVTGFSDDEAIPTWAKGCAAAALQAGLIQGQVSEEGDVVFSADEPITRAEAAVILNQALALDDVAVTTAAYTDGDSVPAWARQAAVNLETVGVLSTDSAGALSLDSAVTRGDAVRMLAGALDVLQAREDSGWSLW